MSDLLSQLGVAKKLLRWRSVSIPIFTPCCKAGSTLRGKPAPQYHCNECGKTYTSLKEFVEADE